jgi:hypothetical protein
MHPLYATAAKAEEHIGTLRRGFHFPVFEAAEGPGCGASWLRVGPGGWVCGQHVERLEGEPTPPPSEALPFRYVNVFRDVEIHTGPGRQFKTGKLRKRKSILSVLGEEGKWVHAYPDEWLDKRELIPRPDRTSSLKGILLGEEQGASGGLEPFALVRYNHIMTWPEPAKTDGDRRRMGKKSRVPVARFSRHPVLGQWPEGELDRADWLQLPEGWVERWRLGVVRAQPRPRLIEATERWILVDLSEQTLVAYAGDTPVYATLVSTGRDEEDKRTPPGIWRITHKLRSGRMSGGTGDSYHYVSDVPWIQYFNEGIALHGVYWHNALGWPQSNGCVNLTPHDARWLFEWTEATLPPGWYSMLTSAARPGTWVVVQP